MANCNCNDFPISCAPHAPGGDCHHHHGCSPHPCPPPDYKGGTSMYIGARYVPIFANPVEWDNEREYEPLTIVVYNGDMYTSKCYVPKGAALPEYPENQTKYWVRTADYNYQFADLKKTVNDLSRLVEQFQKDNQTFTDLINGWNEQVKQWEAKMDEWQTTVDGVTAAVADLTAKLNKEIDRAKAAEQANAAAIAQETTDRKQAISELDAAYKAADAAEKEAREAADTALGERIDAEAEAREAGDNAVKALVEQEQTRAEGEEEAIRHEFATADTALSNRITANKTDIDALKAEQTVQNTNININAKNISDNAAEIAKHAARLTSLESNASDWDDVFPDTTIAQEVQKEELARANADTALNGRIDAQASDIEELRDAVNHKVDQTIYTADQTAQDTKIKTNADAIAAMDTAYKTADAALSASITAETNRATDRENEIETGYKKAVNDLKTEVTGDFVTKTVYDAGQAAQNAKIKTNADAIAAMDTAYKAADTALNASITAETDRATDRENEIETGYKKAVTNLKTVYDAEQAAQDAKITEAKAAADKANTNIGDWETDHSGQNISQCATSLENETAANAAKADANAAVIGDWNTEHPGQTISQEVTRLNGAIPDVSGFVTETTYTAGQAAQDAKITAEQSAREAADTALGERIDAEKTRAESRENNIEADFSGDIGNWSASYPNSTITDEVTALKTKHYATLQDLFNGEHPQLIPYTSTVVCSTEDTSKTTIVYTNPTATAFLPANVTCDEYVYGPSANGILSYVLEAVTVSTKTVEILHSTKNNASFALSFDPTNQRISVVFQGDFVTEAYGKQYDFAIPTHLFLDKL